MSYLDHFQFTEQPFRLTPDPDFVYWSKQHARAKAYMESTIWLADGFVIITGEIGSGKTTLLQSFLGELEDDVVFAVVSQTQLSPTEFLQAVLTEFGFKPFNKRKVELLDMLNMFLIEQYTNGKKVILIVDEAQNLSRKVLEEIRMLSGIETHKEKVLRIILAGQPELKDALDDPGMKQLVQRVRLRFHIGPLDKRELREYILHRLSVAGRDDGQVFAEDAFDAVHRYSGGVPRLTNTLCDTALLCAFADNRTVIEANDIQAAAEELQWTEHESTTGQFRTMPAIVSPIAKNTATAKIEVKADGEVVTVYEFEPGRIIAGRAPDNEIFIKSKFVSRHHAQFTIDDNGCTVEDLNSTNGIFVNNKKVKKYQLRHGESVFMGIHELLFTDLLDERDDLLPQAISAHVDADEKDDKDIVDLSEESAGNQ